jgi:hypothetical protein
MGAFPVEVPGQVSIVEAADPRAQIRASLAGHLARVSPGLPAVVPSSRPALTARLDAVCRGLGFSPQVLGSQDLEELLKAWGLRDEVDRLITSVGPLPGSSDFLRALCQEGLPDRFLTLSNRTAAAVADGVAGRAVVLCGPDDGREIAWTYGLLSGRLVVISEGGLADKRTFQALSSARSLYIAPPTIWKVGDLHALLAARRSAGCTVPMGFFYPFGRDEKEFFLLRSVLYNHPGRANRGPFTFIYPLETTGEAFSVGQAEFFVGRAAGAAELAGVLQRPSEFFFATPHSNGVNMSLGSIVLCSREDRSPDSPPSAKAPPCFYADVCNRETTDNLRLGVSQLRSTVVFLYTCWGVLLRNAAFDVEVALGHRLAASPHVAAFLTTYSMSLLDRASGVYVAEAYSQGAPLGFVTAEFNRLHYEQFKDYDNVVVLFGDPELRLEKPAPLIISERVADHAPLRRFVEAVGLKLYAHDKANLRHDRPAVAPIPDRYFAAVDYTRCVVNATRLLGLDALRPSLDRLSSDAETLWMHAMLFNSRLLQRDRQTFQEPVMTKKRDSLVRRFHRSWLEFYLAMVNHLGGFVRLQIDRYFAHERLNEGEFDSPCPYCGETPARATVRMVGSERVGRRLIECFNCSTILDGFVGFQDGEIVTTNHWRLGVDAEIRLRASAKGYEPGPFLAAAILEPFRKPSDGTSPLVVVEGRWPCDPEALDILLPPMTVLDNWISGCYALNALIVFDTSVLLLRRAVYLHP